MDYMNGELRELISHCEDVEELKRYLLPRMREQREAWKIEIDKIVNESQYTKTEFANLCGVSREALYKWLKGSVPSKKETFIRIGLVANYDLNKMNDLLKRCGRYSGLYAKRLEDCICVFLLRQNYGKEAIKKYDDILRELKDKFLVKNNIESRDIVTGNVDNKLKQVSNEAELEKFINEMKNVYVFAYHKLRVYIKEEIEYICKVENVSIHKLGLGQEWSSSLKMCMYEIVNDEWEPKRNKLLSIGLHLGFNERKMNELLKMAYMEPLMEENLLEGVLLFILLDAERKGIFCKNNQYKNDELCNYARDVFEELSIPELTDFYNELAENRDEIHNRDKKEEGI